MPQKHLDQMIRKSPDDSNDKMSVLHQVLL
jgi:hypothetical protein